MRFFRSALAALAAVFLAGCASPPPAAEPEPFVAPPPNEPQAAAEPAVVFQAEGDLFGQRLHDGVHV
ncbi:MAG: hypothetical protein II839_07100, partial [Kiritimatiellae bacterium]|nr:hypothetical protein [Kiritimatiellia bacterium]